MKRLSTETQMAEFTEQNKEFLNFLYMEGILEMKKGYVEIMVDAGLEILGGGFVKWNRRSKKFTEIGSKEKRVSIPTRITGYYRVYDSESSEELCFFQRMIEE